MGIIIHNGVQYGNQPSTYTKQEIDNKLANFTPANAAMSISVENNKLKFKTNNQDNQEGNDG